MSKSNELVHEGGSFRDPSSRVYNLYEAGKVSILRGVNAVTLEESKQLLETKFFKRLVEENRVVETTILKNSNKSAKQILKLGWDGVLQHQNIPFISYPYEWSFGMLRTAALLHLRILEDAMNEKWTLKDATPFNVQFIGSQPIFIDTPSFVPWEEGEAWIGYRQFCMNFLTPLMIRAYLGIDHIPLMRSYIDGIPPTEARKLFKGSSRFRSGVFSHIIMPSMVENRIASKERDDAEASVRSGGNHTPTMIIGLIQSMRRLVKSLKIKIDHTDWSDYDQTHSYDDKEHQAKKKFVESAVKSNKAPIVWDIGCNTGTFSKISEPFSSQVLAIDGDHNAIEKLFAAQKQDTQSKILPLVLDLANISPAQGWAGNERKAFDGRQKPDMLLALALIHHMRLSANIPFDLFFKWLKDLGCDAVVEFVDRHDEMVIKLLTNKREQYEDYNRDNFLSQAKKYFDIKTSEQLKGGKREIFHLVLKDA